MATKLSKLFILTALTTTALSAQRPAPLPHACIADTNICITDLKWEKRDGDRITGVVRNHGREIIQGLGMVFTLKYGTSITADASATSLATIKPGETWNFSAIAISPAPNTLASFTDNIQVFLRTASNPAGASGDLAIARVWNPSFRREKDKWERANYR